MLELKNNKHNILPLYLSVGYIINAVTFKLLLTSYLKRDLAKKIPYHFNMSCNIHACKGSVRSSCSIYSGSELL